MGKTSGSLGNGNIKCKAITIQGLRVFLAHMQNLYLFTFSFLRSKAFELRRAHIDNGNNVFTKDSFIKPSSNVDTDQLRYKTGSGSGEFPSPTFSSPAASSFTSPTKVKTLKSTKHTTTIDGEALCVLTKTASVNSIDCFPMDCSSSKNKALQKRRIRDLSPV